MSEQTQAQAAMLHALAEHLDQHPELWPVNVLADDRLLLRSTEIPARELVRHADALTETIRVDVRLVYSDELATYRVHVYVVGVLGEDFRLDVWDVVPGLLEAMGPEAFEPTGHAEITVDGLREYAEHGTNPISTQIESVEAAG